MAELARVDVAAARCLARPEALDALSLPESATACRVAPDELLVLREGGAGLAAALQAGLAAADPHALVLDHSDAFAAFALAGPDAADAFALLSSLPLPDVRPAFLQGAVAGVPAKVVAEPARLLVLVPSTLGHQLAERFAEATR